jgi:hypothetical protein
MPKFWPDVDATPTIYYYAVVRDQDGNRVSNCRHSHYTREAAERCAEVDLLPQFTKAAKKAAR